MGFIEDWKDASNRDTGAAKVSTMARSFANPLAGNFGNPIQPDIPQEDALAYAKGSQVQGQASNAPVQRQANPIVQATNSPSDNYTKANALRSFEDKGNGIVRQVGNNGAISFTNVDTASVTDPRKSVQVNSYDGMAEIQSMQRQNALLQSMIASAAANQGVGNGLAILADPNEAANAEKTRRWRMDELIDKARGNPNAIAAAIQAGASNDNEAQRSATIMRGQDTQAQIESAKLAGNPLANELTRVQIEAGKQANAKVQNSNDLLSRISAETDPAKRSAMIESLLASQGKNQSEHRYLKVDGGEEIGPDGMTKIKRPSGMFDTYTRQFIPMEAQPASGSKPGGVPSYEQFAAQMNQRYPGKVTDDQLKEAYAKQFGG